LRECSRGIHESTFGIIQVEVAVAMPVEFLPAVWQACVNDSIPALAGWIEVNLSQKLIIFRRIPSSLFSRRSPLLRQR